MWGRGGSGRGGHGCGGWGGRGPGHQWASSTIMKPSACEMVGAMKEHSASAAARLGTIRAFIGSSTGFGCRCSRNPIMKCNVEARNSNPSEIRRRKRRSTQEPTTGQVRSRLHSQSWLCQKARLGGTKASLEKDEPLDGSGKLGGGRNDWPGANPDMAGLGCGCSEGIPSGSRTGCGLGVSV